MRATRPARPEGPDPRRPGGSGAAVSPAAPGDRTPRLTLATLVLGVHAAVLALVWPERPPPAVPGPAAAPMATRMVALAVPLAVSPPEAPAASPPPLRASTRDAAPVPMRRSTPIGPSSDPPATLAAATPEPMPQGVPVTEPGAPPDAAVVPVAAPAVETVAAEGPAGPAAAAAEVQEQPPPTYATRLPGPATLRYAMRRGALSGEGVLHWQPGEAGGEGYRVDFVGRVFGALLLGWHSQGHVDAHGLAPERFVDRRRQRSALAANFQRSRGVITYSGDPARIPLLRGAQDRLSWMVQLPAVLAANPALTRPGQTVLMQVSGARGDAEVWAFRVVDRQDLNLPAGAVSGALHLRREPRKPFDTRVDVWLDPVRALLPVRLRLAQADGGDATEWQLRAEGGPPPEGPP